MTSMPASRSARAITLAPRSWPSRPGFAMTTRIFAICWWFRPKTVSCLLSETSDYRNFLVFTPDVPERVAHLADRRVGADGVENGRHQVVAARRGVAHRVVRAMHRVVVARPAQLLQPGEL